MLSRKTAPRIPYLGIMLASTLLLAACGGQQRNVTLDAAPADIANVKTLAIASITARPSETRELIANERGHLVRDLTKFEADLFNYLLMHGFNVVDPAVSRNAYAHDTDYEDLYIANAPDILSRLRSAAEIKFVASNMKKLSAGHALKPSPSYTSGVRGAAQSNLTPTINSASTVNPGSADVVSSQNTRIFPQLEFGANVTSPSMTVLGGSDDNRWLSSPMRKAVGELTRRMGADAALIVDGHLRLSPRVEGTILSGALGGGRRFVLFEGTATLVRTDGAILSVESFRAYSDDALSGAADFMDDGSHGFWGVERTRANVNELVMQATRRAANLLAETYAGYAGIAAADDDGWF